MKKVLFGFITTVLMVSPVFASAAPIDDIQASLKHTLAQYSALTADQPVACAIVASKQQVKVGEQYTFLWFSSGSNNQTAHDGHQWDPFGVITMALSRAGTWTYTLKFYDRAGTEVPCSVQITAVQ